MFRGGIEVLERRIAKVIPQICGKTNGVILLYGNHLQKQFANGPNIIIWDNNFCRRPSKQQNLPVNTVIIISNGSHSHTASTHITMLRDNRDKNIPIYAKLPTGIIRKMIRIFLKYMLLESEPEPKSESKPEPKYQVYETEPVERYIRPIQSLKQYLAERMTMLEYPQACKLFESFFTRTDVQQISNSDLMDIFSLLLEDGKFNIAIPDFDRLVRHYRALTCMKPPHVDSVSSRDRKGNLKRKKKKPRASW